MDKKTGYGKWPTRTHASGSRKAHRVIWYEIYGPIPARLVVRHTCDTPPCVNPEHLIVGTHKDNSADRRDRGRYRNGNTDKVTCIHGHEFTVENTRVYEKGKRRCRTCNNQRMQRNRANARRKR